VDFPHPSEKYYIYSQTGREVSKNKHM